MRISDQEPAVGGPEKRSEPDKSSEESRTQGPSAFSRALAKKREANQAGTLSKPGKRSEGDPALAANDLAEQRSGFDRAISAGPVEGSTAVQIPAELQQLVREISVLVNASGNQQVHIELNSKVLKGLQVSIERQNGAIAIQFQSASAEVSRLLSTNIDTLTQGLAERGIDVADIRVTSPQSPSPGRSDKDSASPDRRWPGGRQGGRR